ncbi:nSTAND1 domain-containing NTPase, partial [Streptomyces sparsus]
MAVELLGGRYRIERLLGRGGMGEVYRALDTLHDRHVALKVLSDTADERYARRLRREAELVTRLAHPHIVDVLESGESDGRLYVAMRLVDGSDLRRVLGAGPLTPRRAVRVLAQVAGALDAAHEGGIVHRDVKPSNILIGASDDAYLTDFGIARPLDAEATRLTRTGSYVGSLDYISPEQLRGHEVTGTADVYALACVLYECLTGKVPFPADDPAAKLAAQLNDPPAAPSVFDPRIPPALDMVVATGMDKDPHRRFAGAGELMSAATAALTEVVEAERAGSTADATTPGSGTPGNDALLRAIVSVAARRQRDPEQPDSGNPQAHGTTPEAGDVCPYPGLRSFGTGDAAWFHGRDAEITGLLVRLSRQSATSGPLVVVGASGTGKSSLLRAGLFPALDEAGCDWPRVVLTPGARPVDTLAARIAAVTGADPASLATAIRERPAAFGEQCRPAAGRSGGGDGARLMIVVDQFEQLFTDGAEASDRAAFATALAHAWPATVVLVVRADHVADCIELAPLRLALEAPFVVGPLDGEALREVIIAPARAAGLRVEDGLTDRLIRDAGTRDGSGPGQGTLPRLAHALRETWLGRTGQVLTLGGYEATGGVDRAVAVSADQLYGRLGADAAAALRSALLRLVNVLPDGGLARRCADRGELSEQALAGLVDARLVSVDDEGVRLSHDALLTAWPRLRAWVEADRQELLLRQHLDESATNWRHGGRDRGDLYRGARLAAAAEWAEGQRELTAVEAEFLRASRREQQRATQRLRTAAATLATLLVAALIAGGLALNARDDADRQARIALSRQLSAESLALAEWDPAGAREAALRAWRAAPTTQARGALLSADAMTELTEFDSDLNPVTAVDVSGDGGLIAVGGTGTAGTTVSLRDTRTGETLPLAGADLGEDTVQSLRFSPDGSLLAVAVFGDPGVRVWDTEGRRLLTSLKGNAPDGEEVVLGPIAWHPDGTTLAAQSISGDGNRIGGWNPRTGAFGRWLTAAEPAAVGRAAYDV